MANTLEERRRGRIAELPTRPTTTEFLAQARDDIEHMLDNAVDWYDTPQGSPEFEKAREAMLRVETLALLGYSVLLDRPKAD